jgi:hypothetical protein
MHGGDAGFLWLYTRKIDTRAGTKRKGDAFFVEVSNFTHTRLRNCTESAKARRQDDRAEDPRKNAKVNAASLIRRFSWRP